MSPVLSSHEALVPGGSCLPTPPSCSTGLPNIAAVATAGQDTTAPSVSPGQGSEGQELIIGPWAKPRACLPARWVLPPPPQNHKVGASGPRQHSGQREGPEGCIWPAEDRVVRVWCGGGEDGLGPRGCDCHLAVPMAIVQMEKWRLRGARTGLGHKSIRSLLPPPWPLLPIFQGLELCSGKQATSCWWHGSPAGKSSLESDFHPRIQDRGMVQKFLSSSSSWLPRAASGQSCWAAPAPLGASMPPSVQLGGS